MSTEEPMSIEDRIRTATRAGATLIRDIRPLGRRPEQVASPSPARACARAAGAQLGNPARRRGRRGGWSR